MNLSSMLKLGLCKIFTARQKCSKLHFPLPKVKNGMSIELTCIVDVSKSASFQMQHTFLFYKDDSLLHNTTSEQNRTRYKISPARFADSGIYKCIVEANRKTKSSNDLEVRVEGLCQPKLTALKREVTEGEVVTLRCEVPEEKPPFIFLFNKISSNQQSQEKRKQELKENFASVEFPVEERDRILRFQCIARVNSVFGSETSEPSNMTIVTVVEPFSHPKLTSKSPWNVTEGDRIDIVCTTILARPYEIEILIQKDRRILNSTQGQNSVTYSAIATVEHNGNYTCKVELGRVSKTTSMNIVVSELFAKPILTPSSTDLDENKSLSLWCHINGSPKANFSIVKRPPENGILLKTSSNITIQAQVNDTGSYVCRAEIKGIIKESNPVQITVYEPVLSVANSSMEMVLGETLLLRCQSMFGTPPINYTLFRGNRLIDTITVYNNTYAEFRDRQTKLNNLREYRCEASNRHSYANKSSYKMNITVIELEDQAQLFLPHGEVEDGGEINFLCVVGEGSLPINFTIFKQNEQTPLFYESIMETRVLWQKKSLSKQDAGKYFCEASNERISSSLLGSSSKKELWVGGFAYLSLNARFNKIPTSVELDQGDLLSPVATSV
uniref:Platelet and endothelial cell adhesion molecule 1 n=1 Tax=Gopherus evgoodei TaxID=1825980 RepID=A0A8C4Y8Q1_9SAUR